MELVSIIVPIYKVEPYLEACIASIVNQTYRNLEIILVDDGSPDKCPEICDVWAQKDSRIRVIHKENGGLSDARNAGFEVSSGAYISYVDSDDILAPEYVEFLYEAIRVTGADVSQCAFRQFSGEPGEIRRQDSMSSPVIQTPEQAMYNFSHCVKPVNHQVWDKLYRRELVKNERFLYGRQAQDVLFACHVLGKCNYMARIDNVLYHWRIRPGSASSGFIRQRLDALETYWQSLSFIERYYPQYGKDLKMYYLTLCYGACDWIIKCASGKERAEMMQAVRSYRKKIRLSKEEWAKCTLKDKVRFICSSPVLIIPMTRLRNLF